MNLEAALDYVSKNTKFYFIGDWCIKQIPIHPALTYDFTVKKVNYTDLVFIHIPESNFPRLFMTCFNYNQVGENLRENDVQILERNYQTVISYNDNYFEWGRYKNLSQLTKKELCKIMIALDLLIELDRYIDDGSFITAKSEVSFANRGRVNPSEDLACELHGTIVEDLYKSLLL